MTAQDLRQLQQSFGPGHLILFLNRLSMLPRRKHVGEDWQPPPCAAVSPLLRSRFGTAPCLPHRMNR